MQSGNDASIVVAENISGSEEAFGNLMNDYSKKIGMNNSNFINSSGWPHPRHYSTMYDLSILSKSLTLLVEENAIMINDPKMTIGGTGI